MSCRDHRKRFSDAFSHRRGGRGFMLVYCSLSIVALMGVASLGMDWGRVQTAQTELQRLADAAARAAACGLYDGTAFAKAQTSAGYNKVDGTSLTLQAADVETGTWNLAANAFVPNGTPLNTVRVTARRTQARGNPVPLMFGPAIGISTMDVVAISVCRQSSLCAVGIDALTITGSGTVARKSGEGGGVTTASNGAYAFGTSANSISGDAFYRTTAPTGTVTGKLVSLPYDFAYPAPVTPGGTTNYNAVYASSGTLYVPAGNMAATSVSINGTANIYLTGNCNVYCSGTWDCSGTVTMTSNGFTMTVFMTAASPVTYSNANPLSISLYAPLSGVTLNGPGKITGSVLGKTLTIKGPLEYTGTMPIPATPSGGDIVMVGGGMVTMK